MSFCVSLVDRSAQRLRRRQRIGEQPFRRKLKSEIADRNHQRVRNDAADHVAGRTLVDAIGDEMDQSEQQDRPEGEDARLRRQRRARQFADGERDDEHRRDGDDEARRVGFPARAGGPGRAGDVDDAA